MGVRIPDQLAQFFLSILLGAVLGLLYDLLRAVRLRGGRGLGHLLDAAYCLTAAGSVALFVLSGDGELRLFELAGTLGGAVLYFCLPGPALRPLWDFWLDVLLAPAAVLGELLEKFLKICKKLFSFLRKSYMMVTAKSIQRRAERRERRRKHGQKSGKAPDTGKSGPGQGKDGAQAPQQQADAGAAGRAVPGRDGTAERPESGD